MQRTPARNGHVAAWVVASCAGAAVLAGFGGLVRGAGDGQGLSATGVLGGGAGLTVAGRTGGVERAGGVGAVAGKAAIRYDRDIRPLLSDRCFTCHGPDPDSRRAGLRLDDAAAAMSDENGPAAIVPGDPDGSEMLRRMLSKDADEVMPPPSANKRALTAEEVGLIRQWIKEGAKYEPHWSFVAPVLPAVPENREAGWAKGEVDRFIKARLEAEGIAPSPEADPATLVRRVFLDVTGLPPTPEETDAYLADASPERYERLVERLLTTEPYRTRMAERMATPWLDTARYADTGGIHADNGRQMWSWRDWVLAALRDNMPYDRFVIEQIAGDLLPQATVQQKVASGFNRNHVTTDEGGAIVEEYLVEYAVDRASTTATAFLGLTMGCARCHDHKYDPISQEEFYKFFAYFNSIDEPGLYSQTPDANRAHEPFIEVPAQAQQERLAALDTQVQDLKVLQEVISPEEEREFASFLDNAGFETGVKWFGTPVVAAKAASSSTMKVLEDNSVLVGGESPATDVHEITLTLDGVRNATDARLLLLEALADPTLPGGRVGRSGNGNAVLTALEVESVGPERDGQAVVKRHAIEWLWADLSQTDGDYRFTNLLHPSKGTDRGWAVDGHRTAGDRRLLVVLKEPIAAGEGSQLRVRLKYESIYTQHVLGRVRLSVGAIADTNKLPLEVSNFWLLGPFGTDPTKSPYVQMNGPEEARGIEFARNFVPGNQRWRYDANLKDGSPVPLADGNNVTYLGRLIVSPTLRTLKVSLGSDDGFVIYLNGKEIARREIERGVAPDQDKATLELEAGANLLVLKIVNTGGAAGYYFKPGDLTAAGGYPHQLVGAMLPATARAGVVAEAIKRAWRADRSAGYKERQERVERLERDQERLRASLPRTMVMKELATPRKTYVLKRGQYDQPDMARPVTRGVPAALGQVAAGEPADRLGLARWLVAKENPLTARIAVNRLWEVVFGAGLVRTSEDFGLQGEWPSHPELLDYLAADLRDNGWDMRRTLRKMLVSSTYRQASTPRAELTERDPENRLLARAPRRRLPAEQIRDQALYVSGLLVERLGGPSVKPYQPDGLWAEGALTTSNTKVYERGKGEDLYRRSLYTYWKRAVPPPNMLAFDAPTREFCLVRRPVTVTPLQALVLWNDPQFVEATRVLAQRTLAAGGDDAARLEQMFRRCTGLKPTEAEMASLGRALATFRTRFGSAPEDAAKMLSVGESPLPAGVDKAELASWTMVAGAVMNLYRTTTQQ